MKLLGTLGTAVGAACVATVLFQVVLLAVLWSKGVFADDRWMQMMAALHGVKTDKSAADADGKAGKENLSEQPSLDDLARKRIATSLDFDLRESTLDKSLRDLRSIETQVKGDQRWLDQWKESIVGMIDSALSKKLDESLLEVQRTLESLPPKQAKEQILKMLDNNNKIEREQTLRDTVKMLKAMASEKQKKILSEFKSPTESDTLAEILREIRMGTPEVDELRSSKAKLEQQLAPKR